MTAARQTVGTFTWSPNPESVFGPRTLLLDAGAVRVGAAYLRRGGARGFAHAIIAGRYLSHEAATLTQAVKALQRDIERQAPALFNLDAVRFEGFPV